MALTRQDFKNIPSSGIIPDDRVPAENFAVSYAFTYTGTPNLANFNASFSGKIVLHVLDSLGTIKYVITIEQTYFMLIIPLAPGLVLYTWNQVPTAEKISGTIGEDGPPMTTLGQANFGVDPSEGSGTTDREVTIDSRFYSGIFTEPLDEGDRIVIKFHNLSAGFVTDKASLSLATTPGAAGEAFLFDERLGDRIHVYVAKGAGNKSNVQCRRTRQMRGVLSDGQMQYGHGITLETDKINDGDNGLVEENSRLRDLQLLSLEGGLRACVGVTGGAPSFLRIFLTLNLGEDWNRIMNQPLPFVPSANCTFANQTKVLFYGVGTNKKPAYALLELGAQGFALTKTGEATATDGTELPVKGSINLESCEGGAMRLFTRDAQSGSFLAWISSDEGASWAQEQTT